MEDNAPGCFDGLRSLLSRRKNPAVRPVHREDAVIAQDKLKVFEGSSSCAVAIPCCFCTDPKNSEPWALNTTEEPGPPPYGAPSEATIYRPELMDTIENTLRDINDELRKLSLKIHDHPETAFEEFYAHDTLTKFMSSHGFKITPHFAGIKTAWRAEWSYGKGGRTLGINSEMDALPGIGHACGHNLIAVAGVGVALAAKTAMEIYQIPGKVVLLGTPAEEGGGGKVLLLEKGAYNDMDVCLMCHPGPGLKNSVSSGRSLATQPLTVEYFGHPAHAAAAPWEGQNALDAAVLAYNSISMLRQQMRPDCRVHGIIQGKDWAANIIPDYAKMQWIVRAPSYAELSGLVPRVRACIEAAATAANCRCELSEGVAYYELRQNSVLEQEFLATVKERYKMPSIPGDFSASTDFGNVTYALPAIHPMFAIPTVPNGGNHTPEFTHSARTQEAHEAAMAVAKGLALVGVRVLDDGVFCQKARQAFEDMLRERGLAVSNRA